MTQQLLRELLAFILEDPQTTTRTIRLTVISKYVERIADHSTNITKLVVYLVVGRMIRYTVPQTTA